MIKLQINLISILISCRCSTDPSLRFCVDSNWSCTFHRNLPLGEKEVKDCSRCSKIKYFGNETFVHTNLQHTSEFSNSTLQGYTKMICLRGMS